MSIIDPALEQTVKLSNWIPLRGFRCINIFGILYQRRPKIGKKLRPLSNQTLRHEYIHTMQQRELLYVPFFIIYGLEWAIRYVAYLTRFIGRFIRGTNRKFNPYLAYRKLSFEQEAYSNEHDQDYYYIRKRFSWVGYI